MSPLEDLYQTRTICDRNGTILDEWNHVLLLRDLDRLVTAGLAERVKDVRQISTDQRDQTWYKEISTGNLYVYVSGWERGSPEFKKHLERASVGVSDQAQ
jgi:hypothetical protein